MVKSPGRALQFQGQCRYQIWSHRRRHQTKIGINKKRKKLMKEGRNEGRKEWMKKAGREGGNEGRKEGRKEGGREGRRDGGLKWGEERREGKGSKCVARATNVRLRGSMSWCRWKSKSAGVCGGTKFVVDTDWNGSCMLQFKRQRRAATFCQDCGVL